MKLRIEISSEGANSGVAAGLNEPIINQQISEQTIRVREGEVTLLSGILQRQKTNSISGYPGLSQLPLLKYLFSQITDNDTDDEIVFLLTPHIVRAADISPLNLRQQTISSCATRAMTMAPTARRLPMAPEARRRSQISPLPGRRFPPGPTRLV